MSIYFIVLLPEYIPQSILFYTAFLPDLGVLIFPYLYIGVYLEIDKDIDMGACPDIPEGSFVTQK